MIARQQLALGAAGLTVAKTGEAEVMLGAEPRDLLVAFPVIGEAKVRRLASIAGVLGKNGSVTIAIDSLFGAQQLSQAAQTAGVRLGILVEIDVGMGRAGVAPAEAIGFTKRSPHYRDSTILASPFTPGISKIKTRKRLRN